jgi:hypothetical protein
VLINCKLAMLYIWAAPNETEWMSHIKIRAPQPIVQSHNAVSCGELPSVDHLPSERNGQSC